MTSLTTSVKQGALEIHIFATFTSQHLSLLVKWCFYHLLLLGCLGMIPMNSLVIIGLRSVSQIIPGLSPFHHFQVEEVQFLQVSWCWLGQNVQVTKHHPIWFCMGIDLIQQVTYTGPGLVYHQRFHVEIREQQIMWEWMFGCFPVLAARKPPAPLRTYLWP